MSSNNLLGTVDFMTELEKGVKIKQIETGGSKLIEDLVDNGVSTVIVGKRGSGKSSSIMVASKNIIGKKKEVISVVGPRTINDIYKVLWRKLTAISFIPFEKTAEFLSIPTNKFTFIAWFSGSRKQPKEKRDSICKYWDCRRKTRCMFTEIEDMKNPTVKEGISNLSKILNLSVECPMARFVVHEILTRNNILENILREKKISYIIDFPDNVNKRQTSTINTLIPKLQKTGTLIMVMNEDQYKMSKNFESINRLGAVKFPKMNDDEMKKIIKTRTTVSIMENDLSSILLMSNGSPRKLIENLRSHIFGHQMFEVPDEIATVKKVVSDLYGEGKNWVKTNQILQILEENDQFNFTSRKLGRILSEMGLNKRRRDNFGEYDVSEIHFL